MNSKATAEVVIAGAGIAGTAAAYFLTAQGLHDVWIVDPRPPLSLTSDKSTECYRLWWPEDPALMQLMTHSLELLEALARQTQNAFALNRRGYLYVTADRAQISRWEREAETAGRAGAGPLRVHSNASASSYRPGEAQATDDGADLLLGRRTLRRHFPYLGERIVAALHVRRAGWLDAQQLGMTLLERARARGARLLRAEVIGVLTEAGRVRAVKLRTPEGITLAVKAPLFVNAAGPFLLKVNALLGVGAGGELLVFCERHLKAAFTDPEGVFPKDAPLLIGADPVVLPWSEEERRLLEEAEEPELRHLLNALPPGVHARPEGLGFLGLWGYDAKPTEPRFPVAVEPHFPEVVLRGLATLLPRLRVYVPRVPRPFVDGGYYTKTPENRMLCGPLPVEGAYVLGALSGYGIMAACGAGELLARWILGKPRPEWARAFDPRRYAKGAYRRWAERRRSRSTSQL